MSSQNEQSTLYQNVSAKKDRLWLRREHYKKYSKIKDAIQLLTFFFQRVTGFSSEQISFEYSS